MFDRTIIRAKFKTEPICKELQSILNQIWLFIGVLFISFDLAKSISTGTDIQIILSHWTFDCIPVDQQNTFTAVLSFTI